MVLRTIIIKPLNALLTHHKKEIFDKIDPYVKVYFGGDYYKTDVAKNAGANPVWNNQFCFKNVDLEKNVIRFEVWDKNLILDTPLGNAEFALGNLLQSNNKFNGGIVLLYKGSTAGTLNVDMQFIPETLQSGTTFVGTSMPLQTGTTLGS
jgi:Ca2+-dependent lipid-binding protein